MSGPSRRERLKPLELVGMAAVLGVFAGLITFGGTRELPLASIFAGIAFIAALLVLAMLALAAGGPTEEVDRPVLDRNDGVPEATDGPTGGTAASEGPAAPGQARGEAEDDGA
jgi:hypothetical protein